MSIKYWDDVDQNTDEWHKIRNDHPLSGSTSYDFMIARNPASYEVKKSNFSGNKYTERGHDLEPIARSLLEKVYDIKVQETGFVTNTKYEYSGCSPDGYTEEHLVEIKCFNPERHQANAKIIEAKILSQIQWNMMIMEKKKGLLVLFCPDKSLEPADQLVIKEVEANQAVWDNMSNRIDLYVASRNS